MMTATIPCAWSLAGSQYVDLQGLPGPEPAVEAALAVLLCHKLPRHTDGLMSIGQVSSEVAPQLLALLAPCGTPDSSFAVGAGIDDALFQQRVLHPCSKYGQYVCRMLGFNWRLQCKRSTVLLLPLPACLQFPVNYFTVSEVEQWWPADFVAAFELSAGRALSKQVGGDRGAMITLP
jgi:hypothetical protein